MGSCLNPPPELSLDFKPTFIPKTITQFLGELSRIGNLSEKIFKVDDFLNRLENEMRKIDAFKRELPLCMLLINDAIAALKEESSSFKKANADADADAEPVLEEFIPLKSCDDEDSKAENIRKEKDTTADKKNWLSSTQLWNTNENTPNTSSTAKHKNSVQQIVGKRAEEENGGVMDDLYQPNRNTGTAFIPFKGYCGFTVVGTSRKENKEEEIPVPGLSLITPGIKSPMRGNGLLSKTSTHSRSVPCSTPNVQTNIRIGATPQPQPQPQRQPPQQQTSRKQRRCWSTELHRRFVNALQQLGGSQAATPKQIRELMQVDGLTNDEVKSHLQKYRLHTRRIPTSNTCSANQSAVVLGGGLWMSPQEQYAESSKQQTQSGSPDGPLVNANTGGTSITGGESMDDGDEKSE